MVLITHESRSSYDHGDYLNMEFLDEKQLFSITVWHRQGVVQNMNVTVHNAAHRALRGPGRNFQTFQDAIDAYKTPSIKQAIRLAQDKLNKEWTAHA